MAREFIWELPALARNAMPASGWILLAPRILVMLVPLALEVLREPLLKVLLLVTVAFARRESTLIISMTWVLSMPLMDVCPALLALILLEPPLAISNAPPAFLANTLPLLVRVVLPPVCLARLEATVLCPVQTVPVTVNLAITACTLRHPPHHALTALMALDLKPWPRTE